MDLCKMCERDFCDGDCSFADEHGRLDWRGETIPGSHEPRRTLQEVRDEATAPLRATIATLTAERDAARDDVIRLDRTLTAARFAIDAAGIPDVEPYPAAEVDDRERSLRSGGRVVEMWDRIRRLTAERDAAVRERDAARRLHREACEIADDANTQRIRLINERAALVVQLAESRRPGLTLTAEEARPELTAGERYMAAVAPLVERLRVAGYAAPVLVDLLLAADAAARGGT